MADRKTFTIEIVSQDFTKDPVDNLVEIVEIELPYDFDFNTFQEYLESDSAFKITKSYYQLDRNYTHVEMGAGFSSENIILTIYENIPPEIKSYILEKILDLSIKTSKKIIKKVLKDISTTKKNNVEYKSQNVEIYKTKNKEIRIRTFKKI